MTGSRQLNIVVEKKIEDLRTKESQQDAKESEAKVTSDKEILEKRSYVRSHGSLRQRKAK